MPELSWIRTLTLMVPKFSIKRREKSLPTNDSCMTRTPPTRWRSRFGLSNKSSAFGRSRGCLALGFIIAAQASFVFASPSPVSVEGGPDGLGNAYHWTVSNNHTSLIVRVEIPHYRGSLFFAPKGWTSSCTNLVAVGARDATGVCTATATATGDGIAPGRSATFNLQLASGSVKRGSGEVVIGFADATTHKMSGVLVPVPETLGDRYIPLIGLGTILAAFVVIQVFKSRKNRRLRTDA